MVSDDITTALRCGIHTSGSGLSFHMKQNPFTRVCLHSMLEVRAQHCLFLEIQCIVVPICLRAVRGRFQAQMAELSSATDCCVVHRAENTYCLHFAIKHLPTPALNP